MLRTLFSSGRSLCATGLLAVHAASSPLPSEASPPRSNLDLLRYAPASNAAPIEFLGADNKLEGLAPEIAALIAASLETKIVALHPSSTLTPPEAIRQRQADFFVWMEDPEQLGADFILTAPCLEIPGAILANDSPPKTLRFALARERTDLLTLLNQGIRNLTTAKCEAVLARWAPRQALSARPEATPAWFTRSLLTLVAGLSLVILWKLGLARALLRLLRAKGSPSPSTGPGLRLGDVHCQALIANAPFGSHFYRLEPDDRLVFQEANPAADRILKISHAPLINRTLEDAFPALQQTDIPGIYRRIARDGGSYHQDQVLYNQGNISGAYEIQAFQTGPGQMAVFFTDITQRKRTEEALRRSEAMLAGILNSIPQSIFWKDKQSVYLGCNEVFARNVGAENPEAVVGRTDFDMPWPRTEAEAYRADDQEVIESGQAKRHIIEPLQQADGSRLWIDTTKVPLTDADGHVLGVLGIFDDVTESKNAESTQLERSRLATLTGEVGVALSSAAPLSAVLKRCAEAVVANLDAALARIWILEEPSQILVLNASAGLYTHLDGAHGRIPWGELKVGRIAANRQPHLTNHLIGDPNISDQAWAQNEGLLSFAGYPLVVDDRIVGVLAMFARSELGDVTLRALHDMATQIAIGIERYRTLEALHQSQQMLGAVLHTIPVRVFWKDRNLNYLGCNRHFAQDAGVDSPEDLVGRNDYDLPWRAQAEQYRQDDREILESGQPKLGYELPQTTRDGRHSWLLTSKIPLRDDAGAILGLLGTSEDITERKTAEQEILRLNAELEHRVEHRTAELQDANRELEAFSYSVSHDLRAPLRAIDGYSGILLEDHASQLDPEAHRILDVIRGETKRMARLIEDLLAFSRLGRQALSPASVDITALASEVFDELSAQTPNRSIHFRLASLAPAWADKPLLRQVLVNLLSNAIKYTRCRDAAEIELTGSSEGPEYVYRIRDNGVGFDMRYAHRLFGVFQRLHSEAEYEGTGVGLALTQRILLRHGGRIWAEAVPDQGATFLFSLPSPQKSPA